MEMFPEPTLNCHPTVALSFWRRANWDPYSRTGPLAVWIATVESASAFPAVKASNAATEVPNTDQRKPAYHGRRLAGKIDVVRGEGWVRRAGWAERCDGQGVRMGKDG